MSSRRLVPSLVAVLIAASTLSACGGDDGDGSSTGKDAAVSTGTVASTPTAGVAAIPADAVATVGGEPITRATLDHWVAVVRRAAPATAGQPASSRKAAAKGFRDQALQFLISGIRITREAERRGLTVTAAEIDKAFAAEKQRSYPKAADFQRFLKSSGMTPADLRRRVELNVSSSKLQAAVAKGTQQQKGAALDRFTREFTRRWRAQTFCRADLAVADCANFRGTAGAQATPSSP
ncbi:hypothetical protein DSM112329_04329 [Paraconexibacter sp. AEG42_29]|uniref:SurA N-terminal domain-containing protein n=1 Tax=Paraconexibacter sp. AEG42_29 TaxID=2997339 RepID=A0AAU7B1D7_9ACTN